jgi:hypothetical protein
MYTHSRATQGRKSESKTNDSGNETSGWRVESERGRKNTVQYFGEGKQRESNVQREGIESSVAMQAYKMIETM